MDGWMDRRKEQSVSLACASVDRLIEGSIDLSFDGLDNLLLRIWLLCAQLFGYYVEANKPFTHEYP